jgi:hypothetical protein
MKSRPSLVGPKAANHGHLNAGRRSGGHNVEVQELQRQVIEELERAHQPIRLDVVRVLDRDPYGLGSDGLAVERWNAQAKLWAIEDYPPIAGDIERGQVHVVSRLRRWPARRRR